MPLGDGRLGRAWMHKVELEELARYDCMVWGHGMDAD